MDSPSFVLVSGSKEYLESESSLHDEVPTISTFESKPTSISSKNKVVKIYRNYQNGGCMKLRTIVGFKSLTLPAELTEISRSLGDFLDYSELPDVIIRNTDYDDPKVLTGDSILTLKSLNQLIKLPSYKHASGWGMRKLTRKEICSMWGLIELANTSVNTKDLIQINPVQVLGLVIRCYLSTSSSSRSHLPYQDKPITTISPTTTFSSINVTINNDWIDETLVEKSSRKEDKAPVPTFLWNKRIMASFPNRNGVMKLISAMRNFLIRVCRKRLTRSLIVFLRSSFGTDWKDYLRGSRAHRKGGIFIRSVNAGKDVLIKMSQASWFEWLGGSTLVCWKWHDFIDQARDGFNFFIYKSQFRKSDRKISRVSPSSDPKILRLTIEKFERLLHTLCLEGGFVRWDMHFFDVPKGDSDVRIVFNGTENGLNAIVWVPSFFLSTSHSLGRILQVNTYQLDMDVGEIFVNFPMHNSMRPYCGVNLSKFDDLSLDEKEKRQRWARLWFGFKPSPHYSVRFLSIAQEQARGDHSIESNPFH